MYIYCLLWLSGRGYYNIPQFTFPQKPAPYNRCIRKRLKGEPFNFKVRIFNHNICNIEFNSFENLSKLKFLRKQIFLNARL